MSRCSITLLRVLLEYDQAENIVSTGVTTTVGAYITVAAEAATTATIIIS
jgi:hypothetical protein